MGREKPISGRVELGPHHINPNYFEQNQARSGAFLSRRPCNCFISRKEFLSFSQWVDPRLHLIPCANDRGRLRNSPCRADCLLCSTVQALDEQTALCVQGSRPCVHSCSMVCEPHNRPAV